MKVNPGIDDLRIFHGVRAYGRAQSFNFNRQLRQAEILRLADDNREGTELSLKTQANLVRIISY